MKNKILSFVFSFIAIILCATLFVACGSTPREVRIRQTMPTNVWMEFSTSSHVYKFAKIGNNYYIFNSAYDAPFEIFVKDNLSAAQFGDDSQYYLTYTYSADEWHAATDATENRNNYYDRTWNSYGLLKQLTYGFSAINADFEGTTYIQKTNEVLNIDGNDVECVVYERVHNLGGLYEKEKFWYTKDGKLMVRYARIDNQADDINADENAKFKTTKYETEGLSWATIFASPNYGNTTTGLGL